MSSIIFRSGRITEESLSFGRRETLLAGISTFGRLKTPDSAPSLPGSSDESIVDINSDDLMCPPELS